MSDILDEKEGEGEVLDAEAIDSNEQLLSFNVQSHAVDWAEHVALIRGRGAPVYLQRQFNLISSYRAPIGDHNRREVLVCHDMMGNYGEDRFFNTSKKYDDYRFYHWAAIDYFCYFSHRYITIPPCGWINAAHKHGVRVLGTYITEGETGRVLLHEVLKSRDTVDKVVDAMVQLCDHFGFEGWLINIECPVDPNSMDNLYYFVERLRADIKEQINEGVVFWYDSIIEGGELAWQNEINAKNVRFFNSSDAMLLNYTWNSESLEKTAKLCLDKKISYKSVFVGIDVFGRGQLAKFQSKSTLAHIVKHRFSTGIFAPGWTYETLQQYSYNIKQPLGCRHVNEAFLQRNEKFWSSLWDFLATHPYSMLPFETDFCLGSGKNNYKNGIPTSDDPFFNLNRQSLQPSVPLYQLAERCYDDAFNGGSCLRILQSEENIRLFVSDFKFQRGGLVFAYAYKLDEPNNSKFDCILRICAGNNARDCYLYLGDNAGSISVRQGRCNLSPFNSKYSDLLVGPLAATNISYDLDSHTANGWNVRYYVAAFDGPIQLKDIGVLFQKSSDIQGNAYLGAIYLNEFDINAFHFPVDSNIALIQIYGNDLLNLPS